MDMKTFGILAGYCEREGLKMAVPVNEEFKETEWIPVEKELPIPYEIVAVTLQDQRGVRLWTRAYVNDDGQWRRDFDNINELPGVLAWKRILPWLDAVNAEKGE